MATTTWFDQFAPTPTGRGVQPMPRVTQPGPYAPSQGGFGLPPGEQQRTFQMPTPTDPATYSGFNPTPGPTGTQPGQAGGGIPAGLSADDQQLAQTLRQRYGPEFDLNDPERGIPYFKRRMAESAAEGDARPLDYWLMRASGVNEAQYAIDEAKKGGGTLGSMASGSLLTPYGKQFDPNVALGILDTPAFKAATANATDALQRSAAAKGTLLTGGFAKDLSDYQQGAGLGAINDEYQRQIGGAGFNRDTLWGDQNNAYNKLSGFAQLGLQGAQTLGGYGSGYATNTGNNARTSADLATGLGDAKAAGELARSQGRSSTLAAIANAAGGVDWSGILKRRTAGARA